MINISLLLSLAHKGPHKTKHSASFTGITAYCSSRQLALIFYQLFLSLKGVKNKMVFSNMVILVM